jgi:hypothetical protein
LNEENLRGIGALVETAIEDFEPEDEEYGGEEQEEPGPIIVDGPHAVEATGWVALPLGVWAGLTVRGRLSERTSQPFEWWIVDETNLVRYQNKDWRAFVAAKGAQDDVSTTFKWTVPANRRGPWFLLLSATGKQNDREIEADLYPDD